jgi:hypothetical protein
VVISDPILLGSVIGNLTRNESLQEQIMNKTVAVIFPDTGKAREGNLVLKKFGAEGITAHASAIISKNSDGKLRVLEAAYDGSHVTVVAALIGGLVGFPGGAVAVATDPVLSSVFILPAGNEPAPDEKSAHKVHYGASAFWGYTLIARAVAGEVLFLTLDLSLNSALL